MREVTSTMPEPSVTSELRAPAEDRFTVVPPGRTLTGIDAGGYDARVPATVTWTAPSHW